MVSIGLTCLFTVINDSGQRCLLNDHLKLISAHRNVRFDIV